MSGHSHVRGGAAPPVQKLPTGHCAPPLPPTHAGGQPKPGAAAQGPPHAAVAKPLPAPSTPPGQGTGAAQGAGQKKPGGQASHAQAPTAPGAENVPSGQPLHAVPLPK
jgi:hypothetical protein